MFFLQAIRESRVVTEAGLGIGMDAGVEIGLAFGESLKHRGQSEQGELLFLLRSHRASAMRSGASNPQVDRQRSVPSVR